MINFAKVGLEEERRGSYDVVCMVSGRSVIPVVNGLCASPVCEPKMKGSAQEDGTHE